MIRTICLFTLLSFGITGYAQEKFSLLDLNITLYYNSVTYDTAVYQKEGVFRILNGKNVEWDQNNGEKVYTLDIASVDGEWSDFNSDGLLTFRLISKNKTKITFVRDADGLRVILKVVTRTGTDVENVYSINKVEIF